MVPGEIQLSHGRLNIELTGKLYPNESLSRLRSRCVVRPAHVLDMITRQQRDELFNRRTEEPAEPIETFARVVKDYERSWLDFTIPAGTIVPVEIYTFPPDVIIVDNKRYVVYASESDFFELLQ